MPLPATPSTPAYAPCSAAISCIQCSFLRCPATIEREGFIPKLTSFRMIFGNSRASDSRNLWIVPHQPAVREARRADIFVARPVGGRRAKLKELLKKGSILIVLGTGGVGKTTMAAALGLAARALGSQDRSDHGGPGAPLARCIGAGNVGRQAHRSWTPSSDGGRTRSGAEVVRDDARHQGCVGRFDRALYRRSRRRGSASCATPFTAS